MLSSLGRTRHVSSRSPRPTRLDASITPAWAMHDHHHQQGHAALRLFQIQWSGPKLRVFQPTEPALYMYPAFVTFR
jgi:hypothetical protein